MDTCYDGINKRFKLDQRAANAESNVIVIEPLRQPGSKAGYDTRSSVIGEGSNRDLKTLESKNISSSDCPVPVSSGNVSKATKRSHEQEEATAKLGPFKGAIRGLMPAVNASADAMAIEEITQQTAEKFLDKYDNFLLDCDGVVWETDHETDIPGVKEAIIRLQRLNKRFFFVSNNSLYCRQTYSDKLRKHGIHVEPENIFCASYIAAVYLKHVQKMTSPVYVLGSKKFEGELQKVGLNTFGAGPDPDQPFHSLKELQHLQYRHNVGAVLVAIDTHFDMNKLTKASTYLLNPECQFVTVSDTEKSVVVPPKLCVPTGAIMDAIQSASNRSPIVLGKPHTILFQCLRAAHPEIQPERTVMIGDNLCTDVGFAHNAGIDSALVLSGLTSRQMVKETDGPKPRYIMQSLATLAGRQEMKKTV